MTLLCLEGSSKVGSGEEDEGILSSLISAGEGLRDDEDDKKGHSCLVGVGKLLLKLSSMEVSEGELLESSMISEFSKSLHVWWPK